MLKRYFPLSVLLYFLFSPAAFAQNPKLADSLHRLVLSSASDTARCALYVKLSILNGTPKPKALAWADSALASDNDFPFYHGIAAKVKGDVYYRRAEYDTALTFYSEALTAFIKAKDLVSQATCEYSIGNTLNSLDRYPEALNSFIECEKTAQRAGSKKYRAYGKNGIGSIYFETKQYAASEKAHKEALVLALEVNDDKLLGWTYTCMGNLYVTQHKYNEALSYFKQQYNAYGKTDFLSGQAGALNNIGVCYSYMGKLDSAIVNYEEAAKIKQELGVADGVSIAYQNIAQLYALKHDTATSLIYAYKALDWAHKANSLSELAASYEQVAQAYAGQKKFDSAYSNFVSFKKITDSIYNKKTIDQVAEMTAKYENAKQQEEITLLQKDNKIGQLYNYFFAALGGLVFLLALFFFNRNRIKSRANKLLAEQNEQIFQQKKEITDSINYAKRIQQAIFLPENELRRLFPESFIFFRPRDIVSGDFYWFTEKNGKRLVAAVDCTGHGVPGAFMSMIGNAFLQEIVNERGITRPADILSELRYLVINALKQKGEAGEQHDGMDISLFSFEEKENGKYSVEWAGANNPLWVIRGNECIVYTPDKRPIGFFRGKGLPFTNHEIGIQKGDLVIIFTDGYADQFGGPQGKKFKYSQLQQLILRNAFLSIPELQLKMEETFDTWKGNLEQVDDVLLIGIKIQ